ncbi:hypothetical protein HGRIS_013959 [Hohenbuehelia grisea]|uniref:Uncharacterized protein n=1 Tax=Hohenbuehelia grisea TaxID=104357 RepID=A0ABR3JS60_9AGAR
MFYPTDKHWQWDLSKNFNFQKPLERTSLMSAEVDCSQAKVQSSLEIASKAPRSTSSLASMFVVPGMAPPRRLINGHIATPDLSMMDDGAFDTKKIPMLVEGISVLTFRKFFPTLEILTRADGNFKGTTDSNYRFNYLWTRLSFASLITGIALSS